LILFNSPKFLFLSLLFVRYFGTCSRRPISIRTYNFFEPGFLSTEFGSSLKEIISETNKLAPETLKSLLDDVLTYGIDFLIENDKRLIGQFEREWKGEMKAEVELKKLYAFAKVDSYA
jgi:hypothetical protein